MLSSTNGVYLCKLLYKTESQRSRERRKKKERRKGGREEREIEKVCLTTLPAMYLFLYGLPSPVTIKYGGGQRS